jgi:hypothetical protein
MILLKGVARLHPSEPVRQKARETLERLTFLGEANSMTGGKA